MKKNTIVDDFLLRKPMLAFVMRMFAKNDHTKVTAILRDPCA
jgi:hypothetical protein